MFPSVCSNARQSYGILSAQYMEYRNFEIRSGGSCWSLTTACHAMQLQSSVQKTAFGSYKENRRGNSYRWGKWPKLDEKYLPGSSRNPPCSARGSGWTQFRKQPWWKSVFVLVLSSCHVIFSPSTREKRSDASSRWRCLELRLFAGHAEGQLDILQRYDVLRMQQEESLLSSLSPYY